jgi:vacuolar-type H+-ATPase subunit E/Vma4
MYSIYAKYTTPKILKIYDGIPFDVTEKLITMFNKGTLINKTGLTDEEVKTLIADDYFKDIIKVKVEENEDKIKDWAKNNVLNERMVSRFVNKYIDIVNELYKINNKIDDPDDVYGNDVSLYESKEWIENKLVPIDYSSSNNNRITIPFAHGYGFNTCLNIIKTDKYLPIANIEPENIKTMVKIGKFNETFLNDNSLGRYIFYLGINMQGNIFGINRISPEIIQKTTPYIFSPIYFNSKHYNKDWNNEVTTKELMLKVGDIGNYIRTIRLAKHEMINAFTVEVYEKMKKITSQEDFLKFLDEFISKSFSMK